MRVLCIPKTWPRKPFFTSPDTQIYSKCKKFNARLMFAFVYVLRGHTNNAKITDRVLIRCVHITYLTLSWLGCLPPRPVALTGSNNYMLHTKH